MIKINLLAEKQVSRARTPRVKLEGSLNIQVFLLVGAVALSLLYVGWRWRTLAAEGSRLSAEIQKAQAEEQRLKAVNARGDELNKKRDELQAKVDLITKLKNNQSGPVHMLDQISRSLPDFLWLEAINESGNALSITGKATTYNAVSNFYNNLTQSAFFSDVVLGTTLEAGEGVSFSLTCRFVPPAVRQAQQGQSPPAGATVAPEGT